MLCSAATARRAVKVLLNASTCLATPSTTSTSPNGSTTFRLPAVPAPDNSPMRDSLRGELAAILDEILAAH